VPAGETGTPITQVFQYRVANFVLDWELLDSATLGSIHAKHLRPPIEIIQAKPATSFERRP
jgi:hypothetical protein